MTPNHALQRTSVLAGLGLAVAELGVVRSCLLVRGTHFMKDVKTEIEAILKKHEGLSKLELVLGMILARLETLQVTLMNGSFSAITFVATAGWAETGLDSWWPFIAIWAAIAPVYWVFHGSWLTLLGSVVLAIDITAAIVVSRRAYRILRYRWHVPDWLVGVPLLLIAAIPILLINVISAFIAIWTLPSFLFA